MTERRILVGEIGRPHGVRGLVKLKSFTSEPASIAAYGPLTDESGARRFAVTWKGDGIAAIDGIADRDAAQRLTGTRLYVARDQLPPAADDDEFYLADLIGLPAFTAAGEALGTVKAVEEHGAGAFLVLLRDGRESEIPFTRACVPNVDLAAGRITVVPPAAVIVPPQPGDGREDAA